MKNQADKSEKELRVLTFKQSSLPEIKAKESFNMEMQVAELRKYVRMKEDEIRRMTRDYMNSLNEIKILTEKESASSYLIDQLELQIKKDQETMLLWKEQEYD